MVNSISELARIWQQSLKLIDERLNERQIFDSFFADTYIDEIKGDTITIVVPNLTAERLLSTKYIDLIKEVVNEVTEFNYELAFIQSSSVTKSNKGLNYQNDEQQDSNFFKDAEINESLTFESFVEGEFNKEAYKAAKVVADHPGEMFNPLFIFSNSGLGKTHLLHAIGNHIKKKNPRANILYINADDFVDEYIRFVKGEKESETLKDYFTNVDVLLFDDVQFLENKVKTQEAFFYIYQKLYNKNKQIVITSDRQPTELVRIEDRLITRFSQGLTVKINNPDQDACVKILKKLIEKEDMNVDNFDPAVLYFYADKFNSNVRELEGAFKRLIFHIRDFKQIDYVDLDVAIEAVQDITGIKNAADQLSEQKIINTVADYYGLIPSQLTGKTRTGQIALARHVAMYLIRNNIDVPLIKIGSAFGGRDHTTVMNAITKVENMLKTDEGLKETIDNLQKQLKAK